MRDDEARFVRCFDKCDPVFRHLEDQGVALRGLGITTADAYMAANEQVGKRIRAYSDGFEDVLAIRDELQNRVAKSVFSAV